MTEQPATTEAAPQKAFDKLLAACGGDQLKERMLYALGHRAARRLELNPQPGDTPEVAVKKVKLLLSFVGSVWPRSAVDFINDCIWVNDAKGQFQANDLFPDVSPRGAAPLILEDKQKELVIELQNAIMSKDGKPLDVVVDKARQVAATWIILAVFVWAWMFRPSSRFIVSTYDIDLVDGGGKGSRDSGSLFGRIRFMLDCLVWSYPRLKFNQHFDKYTVAKERKEGMTDIGFLASEDVTFKLVRPRWMFPLGRGDFHEMHGNASRNVILGRMPKGNLSRGDNYTAILLDEMGEYETSVGPDAGREAHAAARAATNHLVMCGTVAKNGGIGTLFREFCTMPQTERRRKVVLDWCHLSYYLRDGRWNCGSCGARNALTGLRDYRTGEDSRWRGEGKYRCASCKQDVFVPLRSVTSDWFEAVKESVLNNPVVLAREYWHDWDAAYEDTVFPSFSDATQVRAMNTHGGDWMTIMGFDPGFSEDNPAAFVAARYSPEKQWIHVIAAHQAARKTPVWWVPFFKCWHPKRLPTMRVLHSDQSESWDLRDYLDEELAILSRLSAYTPGEIQGDKYGTHQDGGRESVYQQLRRYGIEVRSGYSSGEQSPENALIKLRDVWIPRLTVAPEVASHRSRWSKGHYPSLTDAIRGARWIATQGHTAPKREVSAKEPKHVKHYIDAMRYMIRELDDTVSVRLTEQGVPVLDTSREEQIVTFGETWDRQFQVRP